MEGKSGAFLLLSQKVSQLWGSPGCWPGNLGTNLHSQSALRATLPESPSAIPAGSFQVSVLFPWDPTTQVWGRTRVSPAQARRTQALPLLGKESWTHGFLETNDTPTPSCPTTPGDVPTSGKERYHWIHFTSKGVGAEVTCWAQGRHPPKASKNEQRMRRSGLGQVQALDWAPGTEYLGQMRKKSLVPKAAKC